MAELPQPSVEIKLAGKSVSRGHILNDYGNRVHWRVSRDGQVVATPECRTNETYVHAESTPGTYEVVIETWKHEGYQSKALGKYIEISNKVTFTV